MPKAGGNVRRLGLRRRKGAILRFAGALGSLAVPFLALLILPNSPGLVALSLIAGCVGAFTLYNQGKDLWTSANRADQGARGEENVAQILKVLSHRGWKIEYNIPLPQWGDADVFALSPRGNCFVVDVKTNKGGVFFDGSVLKLRFGRKTHDFPKAKDILKAVRGQAASVKDLKRLTYVQAILCFTNANLSEIAQSKINGVYVISAKDLVNLLQKLDTK